jgi:cell division protein FtsB
MANDEPENQTNVDMELDRLLKTRIINAKIEELRKTITTLEARIQQLEDETPF